MITRREVRVAETIAHRLAPVLSRRGLKAPIRQYLLAEVSGMKFLLAEVDLRRVDYPERYVSAEVLEHLRMETGYPVYISREQGLRYVLLLSPLPKLPRQVPYPPETPGGEIAIGVGANGLITLPWQKLGHVLVAGQTGSGKSAFLRLLVYQALRDGMHLLLSDLDRATFPMLADHPALRQPIAETPESTLEVIRWGLAECDRRAGLYQEADGFPDSLEEYNREAVKTGKEALPRILVVLDEFSAVAVSEPQIRLEAARLGWRGRKFGIHIIFAAQEFTKEVIGAVRDQIHLAVCFRVRSAEMAKRLHCSGAESISPQRPGLAVTDRWGAVQTCWLDKSLLGNVRPALNEEEREVIERAGQGGQVSIPKLVEWGWSEWRARRLLEEWEQRGWVVREGTNRRIAQKLREILSTPQAPQRTSKPSNGSVYAEIFAGER